MGKEGKAVLTLAIVFVALGLAVLVLVLEAYAVPSPVFQRLSSIFGGTVGVEGDGMLALSMLLLFQGFSLFEPSRQSARSVFLKLWLFIPFFLVLAMLSSEGQGSLLLLLAGLSGGREGLLLPSLISVALTVFFTLLSNRRTDKKALPQIDEVTVIELPADKNEELLPEPVDAPGLDDRPPLPLIPETPAKKEEDELPPGVITEKDEHEKETEEALARILKANGKDDGTYKSLQRKRKEVLKLTKEDRKQIAKKYFLYKAEDGRTGRIAEILKSLKPYTFSVGFDLVNSKGLRKSLSYECIVVPAFSEQEAKEIVRNEIKAYSKGGYVYTKTTKPLTFSGLKQGLVYDDFLMPWVSENLRYENDDTIFVWDFLLKYSKDRKLDLIASGVRPRGSQRFGDARIK